MSDSPGTLEVPPISESESPPRRAPLKFQMAQEVHWILLCLASTILIMSAVFSVSGETQVDLPWIGQALPGMCQMKNVTGLDCPGCGLTRCFISLAHGDVSRAWHFNPAGIMVFLLVAAQVPYRAMQIWRLRRGQPELDVHRFSNIFTALMVSALVSQWVWKLLQLAWTWNA